jgi:hypothetical protein
LIEFFCKKTADFQPFYDIIACFYGVFPKKQQKNKRKSTNSEKKFVGYMARLTGFELLFFLLK